MRSYYVRDYELLVVILILNYIISDGIVFLATWERVEGVSWLLFMCVRARRLDETLI